MKGHFCGRKCGSNSTETAAPSAAVEKDPKQGVRRGKGQVRQQRKQRALVSAGRNSEPLPKKWAHSQGPGAETQRNTHTHTEGSQGPPGPHRIMQMACAWPTPQSQATDSRQGGVPGTVPSLTWEAPSSRQGRKEGGQNRRTKPSEGKRARQGQEEQAMNMKARGKNTRSRP